LRHKTLQVPNQNDFSFYIFPLLSITELRLTLRLSNCTIQTSLTILTKGPCWWNKEMRCLRRCKFQKNDVEKWWVEFCTTIWAIILTCSLDLSLFLLIFGPSLCPHGLHFIPLSQRRTLRNLPAPHSKKSFIIQEWL